MPKTATKSRVIHKRPVRERRVPLIEPTEKKTPPPPPPKEHEKEQPQKQHEKEQPQKQAAAPPQSPNDQIRTATGQPWQKVEQPGHSPNDVVKPKGGTPKPTQTASMKPNDIVNLAPYPANMPKS